MTPDEPTRIDVEKWLASSGYPLEMRAAKTLRDAGYSEVAISQHFRDPDEPTKLREIDVVGSFVFPLSANSRFVVRLVCECKYSKGSPWINFTSPRNFQFGQFLSLTLANDAGQRYLAKAFSKPKEEGAQTVVPLEMGYHVVRFARDEHAGKKSRPAEPHEAIDGAIRASQARASTVESRADLTHACEIVIPVVVVDGTLYAARLGARGLPKLRRVRGTVILRERLDDPGLSVPVQILTVPGFRKWVAFFKSFWEATLSTDAGAAIEALGPAFKG
jgi:hypothetical protein